MVPVISLGGFQDLKNSHTVLDMHSSSVTDGMSPVTDISKKI